MSSQLMFYSNTFGSNAEKVHFLKFAIEAIFYVTHLKCLINKKRVKAGKGFDFSYLTLPNGDGVSVSPKLQEIVERSRSLP
jgi:hypothetical protein